MVLQDLLTRKCTFRQYVWGTTNHGIIPKDREIDAEYKIKSFDSLSESVLLHEEPNTNFHYNEFRINDLS